MQPEHIETATRATVATAASYTSSGGLLIFGMATNDFAALVGAVCVVFTAAVNFYYRHKEDKRNANR